MLSHSFHAHRGVGLVLIQALLTLTTGAASAVEFHGSNEAIADTMVFRANPTNLVTGGDSDVDLLSTPQTDTNSQRLGFFKFDTSFLPATPDPVTAASVTFFVNDGGGSTAAPWAIRLWGIPDGVDDENFVDSGPQTLTWSSATHTQKTATTAGSGLISTGLADLGTATTNAAPFGSLTFDESSNPALLSFL